MNKHRTTIRLSDADRAAIREIQARWGVDTASAAIRLALRVLAAQGLRLDDAVAYYETHLPPSPGSGYVDPGGHG